MTSYQIEESRCAIDKLRIEAIVPIEERIGHGCGFRDWIHRPFANLPEFVGEITRCRTNSAGLPA